MAVYFYARKEAVGIRKLKRYKQTQFKATDSVYDKASADYAVAFVEALSHTKGTWAGKPFELIDWQEQIIRDVLLDKATVFHDGRMVFQFKNGTEIEVEL